MKTRPRNLTLLLILLGGCVQQDPGETARPAPEAGSALSDEAWTRALIEHREETDEEFRTSSTSPIAGAQRLRLEADQVYLTRQDRTFALASEADPAAVMVFRRDGAKWTWEDSSGDVAGEAGGEPLVRGSVLDGPAGFDTGGIHVSVYPSEDALTFIVYDPERPEKVAFEHLLYFPPDRSLAMPATLHRLAEPEKIEMLTSRSLKKTFYRYATLRFRVDGEEQELTAFKSRLSGEGSESLFVPFRDATSGNDTYGAGRFLDLEEPLADQLILDFNRAYNPLCNYSPAFNCPIPPRENRLEVPIRAGERTYPH